MKIIYKLFKIKFINYLLEDVQFDMMCLETASKEDLDSHGITKQDYKLLCGLTDGLNYWKLVLAGKPKEEEKI